MLSVTLTTCTTFHWIFIASLTKKIITYWFATQRSAFVSFASRLVVCINSKHSLLIQQCIHAETAGGCAVAIVIGICWKISPRVSTVDERCARLVLKACLAFDLKLYSCVFNESASFMLVLSTYVSVCRL